MIVDQSKSDLAKVHFPNYNRQQLKHGIVHLSVGNFHRSHLAYYMDIFADEYQQTDWGIIGIGVRSEDRLMSIVLKEQQGLYTLVSKGTKENDIDVRVIGSLINYIFAPDEPEKALAVLVHSDTKIVSMTITVAGYNVDLTNKDIQHDLINSKQPKTIFGFLVHALDARRRANQQPFTIVSCDNVQQNGEVIKKCVLQFAQELNNSQLIEYIQTKVTFPNTMVDRITPATTDADREFVRSYAGLTDGWPVITEHFIQWVIEDKFCNDRPPFELLSSSYNVLLTDQVESYECMKMRLLNASHTAMSSLGYLIGYTYIHEIISDLDIQTYIKRLMKEEITPILPSVPGIDFNEYENILIERFSNPHIKDKVVRILMDGASKFPKMIVPTIVEQFKRGQNPHFFALTIAAWIRYLGGTDERNQPIVLQDPTAIQYQLDQLAKNGQNNVKQILSVTQVFDTIGENIEFVTKVERLLSFVLFYFLSLVVLYNETDGSVIRKYTAQGYADLSTWSRGQAWAIHGFTIAYRYTKYQPFLDKAIGAANYFLSRLTSAKAIVDQLTTPSYLILGNKDYVLRAVMANGTLGPYPSKAYDVATICGDYYLTEAVLRLTKLGEFF